MIGPLEDDGLEVRPGSFQTVHSHFINDFSAFYWTDVFWMLEKFQLAVQVWNFQNALWVKTNPHIEDTMFPEKHSL